MLPWPLPPPQEDPPLTPASRYQKQFWDRAGPGGRYRPEGILTVGGQGRLWRAVDPRDGRSVVVKTLREDRAGRPEARRLVREGRILHDLTGAPTVMQLLDYGPESLLRGLALEAGDPGGDVQSDFPWLVLALYRHQRLEDALQRFGPFGSDTGAALGIELARALAYLHRNKVVHRDLTPGNVLLTGTGLVLADFGVAWSRSYRDIDGTRPMTTGLTEAVGLPHTPGWSAPEVKPYDRDDRSSRNPAVDVFGWGLYVATAAGGRHPWADAGYGRTAVAGDASAMSRGSAPDLTAVTDRVLREAVREALSNDPEDRPTADQLIEMLASGASYPRPARRRADAPAPAATVRPILRPSLGLSAVVLLVLAVLLMWASGLFSFVVRELTPFEQGPAVQSSSLGQAPTVAHE